MVERAIGILGGTFDPPHIAHLAMGRYMLQTLNFSAVYFVPCGVGVAKMRISPFANRLRWLKKLLAQETDMHISTYENQSTAAYTIDTLQYFSQKMPDASLFFALGADAYATLPTWQRWSDLLTAANLLVFARATNPEAVLTKEIKQYERRHILPASDLAKHKHAKGFIIKINHFAFNISSRMLRQTLNK